MTNNWYWAFKNVLLGPFLRVYNRPTIDGGSNIPTIGAAILASNHQSVMDSFYLPLLCPRQITFPAKSEYFTTPGIVGRLQKWFYTSVGQVPLDRSSAKAGEVLLTAARNILDRGELFGIYPEGTRSPAGRIYRGKTGAARVAIATDVPIIPIAMIGRPNPHPTCTHGACRDPCARKSRLPHTPAATPTPLAPGCFAPRRSGFGLGHLFTPANFSANVAWVNTRGPERSPIILWPR